MLLAGTTAGALVIAAAPAALGGPSATTWYVAETGAAAGPCNKAAPCDITYATTNAPSGTTVIIEPGTYGSSSSAITQTLGNDGGGVTFEGAPGAAMPVISSTHGFHFIGSSLSHVEFLGSGNEALVGTDFSHVISIASHNGATACQMFGSITDSLCVATGANALAIWYDLVNVGTDTAQNATIRGVTAVASGSNGNALDVEADQDTSMHLSATNDIFRGPGGDISVQTATISSTATLTVAHSSFDRAGTTAYPGTVAKISSGGHNTTKPAKLTSSYREALGSPTIDAGASDASNDTDLAGNPRQLGSAPDMGAYEFAAVKPTLASLKVVARHKHSLTVTVRVNAGDEATRVALSATHAQARGTSGSTSVGSAATPRTVRLTVRHLKRHTKYHLRVIARNANGSAAIGGKSATTK